VVCIVVISWALSCVCAVVFRRLLWWGVIKMAVCEGVESGEAVTIADAFLAESDVYSAIQSIFWFLILRLGLWRHLVENELFKILRSKSLWKSVLWGVVGSITIIVFWGLIGLAIVAVLSPTKVKTLTSALGLSHAYHSIGRPSVIILIVDSILLVPVVEEFAFRGMFYASLRKRYGIRISILFCSAIFSVFHANLGRSIVYFSYSVICCLLYEKDRSLSAPIICHCLVNGLGEVCRTL